MTDPFENPYASPTTYPHSDIASESTRDELAGRFTRFAAAMVDGILLMVIVMPIQFLTGFMARAAKQEAGFVEQILMSLVGIIAMLMVNGYTLLTRGQTIGKLLTNIQILDYKSVQLLPFVRVYVYRHLWTFPLVLLVLLIPGNIDNFVLYAVIMIDVLMIFGDERRCLHDLIAGSKVVLYRPGRQRLN